MSLSSCSAQAAWARCIARATHAWTALSRSRFYPPRSPQTMTGCTASSEEARSASALNHPNIVTIYELGQDGSCHYIAMELVEGKTLRELLGSGLLPMRKAIEIAAQIADGLTKAHEAGIAHRDLKPENLMVSHDGFVKILDFGLAKLTSPGREQSDMYNFHVADHTGSAAGNGGIHVAGAGRRGWSRFPVRPILVRLGALRDGDRKAPLSEKHSSGDTGGHSPGTGRTDRSAKPRRPGSAVLGYREVPGKRAREALRLYPRPCKGTCSHTRPLHREAS